MNLRYLVSRQSVNKLLRFNGRPLSPYLNKYVTLSTISTNGSPGCSIFSDSILSQNVRSPKPFNVFGRHMCSTQETEQSESSSNTKLSSDVSEEKEEDGTMNEFLSRFVWIMRGKLSTVYPDYDKETINGMLLIIVAKVVAEMEKGGLNQITGSSVDTSSQEFSEDLWKTVWEASNKVLEDMEKERKKVQMKKFLQSEEVKEMCRFAGEAGIRGDMLRELRFKWAREKMEESEFYESLERLREQDSALEKAEAERNNEETVGQEVVMAQENEKVISLPKRHGMINYKIYGLDLSDPKWAEVAEKVHETGNVIWPQEPKPITGKCKLVLEKILSLKEEVDPSQLLAEWAELLQPNRVDWVSLLERLEKQSIVLYCKVAELVLDRKDFETNIRDYSKLMDSYAKQNRLEDAERILKKMTENGLVPDIIIATALVHMYCKAGNLERAKEAFDSLRNHGFHPDAEVYQAIIMAYISAGQAKLAESLVREMEAWDLKPSMQVYMALLRSFAARGDLSGAGRISTAMQFAGFQPNLESCTLLVEAYGKAGEPDQARNNFDYMMKLGHKPDDRCIASMIAAYQKKNLLDKALHLLLQLEKDGSEPGPATYTVLVDWFSKLVLVDEAEQLLSKISEHGEAPPLQLHVSLCDMYARARIEKKALQALGVLEAKKEQLESNDYERIINGLVYGGFVQDAQRVHGMMEAQGFVASDDLQMTLMTSQTFKRKRPTV